MKTFQASTKVNKYQPTLESVGTNLHKEEGLSENLSDLEGEWESGGRTCQKVSIRDKVVIYIKHFD